jgi:protein-L-isoaspartate(D-aspartate) O-methyltransferase
MNKSMLLASLRKKGIPEIIVDAFDKVKRENYVPEKYVAYSYEDLPIPLEEGSTLSQPYTTALMLSLLEPKQNQKILEIGSGSGYVLAILSEIIKNGKVYGLELSKRLAISSKRNLIKNSIVEVMNRSGEEGFREQAPFDRILVSASCRDEYIPTRLLDQLSDPGILVVPVKQTIIKYKKESGKITKEEFPGFVFVNLIESA